MSFFKKLTQQLTGQPETAAPPAGEEPVVVEETAADPGYAPAEEETFQSRPLEVQPEPAPPPPPPRREIELEPGYGIDDLLRRLVKEGGSDLHLAVGCPPTFRLDGDLHPSQAAPLEEGHARQILLPILGAEQIEHFHECGNLDFSYEIPGVARFRGNYFRQHRGMSAVFRIIPARIPTVDELKLPPVLKSIAMIRSGLVLVTGPTGSGKSTTLAAMIDHVNDNRKAHIITIEDPIEFFHPSKQCLIDHREVGQHAVSFADALRAALREDPDIILVGEMRDLDTIYNAIKAAETGALVFGTLHTNSAAKTIDRIIDVFPAKQQAQIRSMLSESLKAVVAQLLLKKLGGGRVAVHEILIAEPGFSNMIREGKTSMINNFIHTGKKHGMQSMDSGLLELLNQGLVSRETVLEKCQDPNFFKSRGMPVA